MNDYRMFRLCSYIPREYVRLELKTNCLILVNDDRRAAIENATFWLKTYCRHWARNGIDWQTLDNLNAAERITARQHMGTLRRLGRLREGGFRGNFEVLDQNPG